jgi:histidyl-tRNA synthetase
MTRRYQALRGTRDILPDETPRWQLLERIARSLFARHGFQEIRTPILEPTELFARSVGADTDIVGKEMYAFEVGGEAVCLRPENTASVARAFVEHSLHRGIAPGYPERYFYIGPMFRRERPQKGRQRQFHQIGVEVLGAHEPLADAETIQMADALLEELAITERQLLVNSVGDAACRPDYHRALRAWLEPRLPRLCSDCRRRYQDNPLRVFDCKVETDRELLQQAPTLQDLLCAGCREHLQAVLAALERLGIAYRIDPRIVRGLDYYERTVFEIVSSRLGAQNAILGGGRYDGLVQALGGPAVPGFGFAVGMERLLLLMPEERRESAGIDLVLVSLGPHALAASIPLARRLRAAGIACTMPLVERPLGAQLKRANRIGARFALFIGEAELDSGAYELKDLRTGQQTRVGESAIVAHVKEGQAP